MGRPAAKKSLPVKRVVGSQTIKKKSQDPSVTDWQSTKPELKDRFEYIFKNQLFHDVNFIVGSKTKTEKIPALKVVLMAGSSVFLTMFSEKWSAECSEIKVEDVSPATFKELLRFLYSDKVNLCTETVTEILYVAKKYAVKALETKCTNFLQSKLCPQNAFTILIQARLFEEKKLVSACLEVIDDHTADALMTDDFCNIDNETLCLILQRSNLIISEMELFEAILRWSLAACGKEKLPVNPQNQRLVLKNAVSLLRFPLMSSAIFESQVVDTGLLLDAEVISMLRYFVNNSTPSVSFSNIPRRNMLIAKRYQGEKSGIFTGSGHSTYSFVFFSKCEIRVIGIGLYGSPIKAAKYTVSVTLKRHGYSAILGQVSGVYDGCKNIYRVMLNEPVLIMANFYYRFEVEIQGYYFLCGTTLKLFDEMKLPDGKKATIYFKEGEFIKSPDYDPSLQRRATYTVQETFNSHGQIPEILFQSFE